jgi:hypothetical protein
MCCVHKKCAIFPSSTIKRREKMKIAVFWDVASCSLVETEPQFQAACCLSHNEQAARSSKVSVNSCQTAGCSTPEDSHLHSRRSKKLKSQHVREYSVPGQN